MCSLRYSSLYPTYKTTDQALAVLANVVWVREAAVLHVALVVEFTVCSRDRTEGNKLRDISQCVIS